MQCLFAYPEAVSTDLPGTDLHEKEHSEKKRTSLNSVLQLGNLRSTRFLVLQRLLQ